ncbi:MAG TPA: heavy metal resistance protein CzcO [Bacteroidales bacterium]|jgi:putative flavoprotein involved in K+ transport|nr:heavy metal resistance protein CzcO [Bacteroidales bacterium]HBZ21692.1 heavy metal resistance protein CzcO [Bacteroidales bacterium]
MRDSILDVIVIGAGHAGLSISYYLKELQLDHIVFEQGKTGNSWRHQRWESFRLNTPNKYNLLPGQENTFPDAEGFSSAADFVFLLQEYFKKFDLPVSENSRVLSVDNFSGSKYFSVCVSEYGTVKCYNSKQLVISSGGQNIKNIPSLAKSISEEVFQLHASEFRNSSLLPDGAVLVVGSAQSGVQIAEDLIEAGRKVFLSTSQVARVPRRYRGKDIVDWLMLTGFNDVRTSDITDPRILSMKQPQASGLGIRGHTVSLQSLARKGAVILGKIETADPEKVFFQPDAAAHVKFADEFSGKMKNMIDDYVLKSGLQAPPAEEDIDDRPDEKAACASGITSLNLKENNVTSVIWTTGFKGDFSYLKLPVFDENGLLKHTDGVSDITGLYFLGLPWLRKRKSGIISGIIEDARFMSEKLKANNC